MCCSMQLSGVLHEFATLQAYDGAVDMQHSLEHGDICLSVHLACLQVQHSCPVLWQRLWIQ